MTELLYFSSSDLMIEVDYDAEENTLQYCSHRNLTFGERLIVEQYLLTNIAVKTDYYKKCPARLNYSGTKIKLVKELNQFHLKNTIKAMKEKERDVENSVKNLIDSSMSNYYFEQIGDLILNLRRAAEDPADEKSLSEYINQLEQLVDAYNKYSVTKVGYQDVLPKDLIVHLDKHLPIKEPVK
jgi:hypothetical protein